MKKIKLDTLINALLLIFLVYVLYQRAPDMWRSYQTQGQSGAKVVLENLNGVKFEIPPQDGKPSVLIFWATWCQPCQVELGRYKSAVEKGEIPLDRIFLVSIGEDVGIVISAVKERAYPFQVFLDPRRDLAQKYNVALTPTVVHVKGDGIIDWVGTGLSPTAIFRAQSLFK